MRRAIVYRPPHEPTAHAPTRGLREVWRAFAAAGLVMLVLGAQPLRHWTEELPVNPVTDRLVLAAEIWHGWMERAGPARLHPWLKTEVEALTKR
jgi:hypothetical protein